MVIGLGANLTAADAPDRINDIRVSFGVVPSSRNVQESAWQPATGIGNSESLPGLSVGLRVDVGYYRALSALTSTGTLVIGVGFFDAQQSGDADQGATRDGLVGPIAINTVGADLSLAYAYPLSHGWHLEIGPFAGIGSAHIQDRAPDANNNADSVVIGGHGIYREFGGRLGIFYTSLSNHFLVHADVAYYAAKASDNFQWLPVSGGVVNESLSVHDSGFSPSLGFGYRF
jgi:hypothetical protein